MKLKYPVYKTDLSGNEKKYVLDCIDSSWVSSKGKYIELFEKNFSQFLDVKYATSVCNGTVALHLALISLGIGPEDEVIVPTFTYIASVNAISYVGAKPIFVDSRKDSWQIDIDDIKNKISSKTKAILAVHLYGHPCDLDGIINICKDKNIFLIEDCAESLGSLYNNQKVGTFGDIATFSFYGNKTITTGEGGMVVTNDKTLYERALHFKGQGLAKYRQYWHDVIGYNFRMTNLCAAIGLAQLERIDKIIDKKIQIAEWYKENLNDSSYIFHNPIGNVKHTYWMCSILCETPDKRDQLMKFLEVNGIETRPTFYPVHTMPMYSKKFEKHENSEYLGWRGLNLPSYPQLTKSDIKFISNIILSYK
jgi:perosamine synthetase